MDYLFEDEDGAPYPAPIQLELHKAANALSNAGNIDIVDARDYVAQAMAQYGNL